MAKSEIENKIKDKIQFAEEAIDSNLLWANIESDLPTDRKSRRLFWVFLFSALVIISAFVYNYYLIDNKDISKHASNDTALNTNINSIEKSNIQKNLINENNSNEIENASKKNTTSQSIKTILSSNTKNSKTRNYQLKKSSSNYLEQSNKHSQHLILSSQFNNQLSKEELVAKNGILIIPSANETINKLDSIQAMEINLLEQDLNIPLPPNTKAVDVNRRKLKLFPSIEITGGYSLPFSKSFAKQENSEVTSFINDQVSSTKFLEAFNFEVLFKVKLKNNLFLKSGLSYFQIYEQFVEEVVNTEIIERENEVVSTTTNANGSQLTQTGNVEFLRESIVNKYYFSTYKLIGIPLVLGYEIQKNKFLFDASIGTNIGLSFTQSGFQNPYEQALINAPDIYKSRLNLSATAELGAGYRVSDHINVWTRFNYFSTLSSVTENSYEVSTKMTSVGSKVSLEYLF